MTKSPSAVVPKVLELGPCKQCGNQVVVAMQKGVPLGLYAHEEFCSAVCAREYHGAPPAPSRHQGATKKW